MLVRRLLDEGFLERERKRGGEMGAVGGCWVRERERDQIGNGCESRDLIIHVTRQVPPLCFLIPSSYLLFTPVSSSAPSLISYFFVFFLEPVHIIVLN
jgi:hypothetical protein